MNIIYQKIAEEALNQAIMEMLGEKTYKISIKFSDSVENLITTLKNARSLTAAMNQNVFNRKSFLFVERRNDAGI